MIKIIKLFVITTIILINVKCVKNKKDSSDVEFNKKDSFEIGLNKKDTIKTQQNYENNIINEKWIIGDIGINGEKPDTIHFISKNKMRYVSTDTGEEILDYTFKNDTLSYVQYLNEYDMTTDKEIKTKFYNKLVLKNDKFYLFYLKTKINNKDTVYDLSKTNVFRRVK